MATRRNSSSNPPQQRRSQLSKYVEFLIVLAIAEGIVLLRNRSWSSQSTNSGSGSTPREDSLTSSIRRNAPTLNKNTIKDCQVTIVPLPSEGLSRSTGDVDPSQVYIQKTTCSGTTTPIVQWQLNETAKIAGKQHFCLPWYVVADLWWTHHVGWKAATENQTHYCFRSMNPARAKFFRDLHDIQFNHLNCHQVMTKPMWQAGWGADFSHLVDGLLYANEHKVPFQVYNHRPWHYAATKDGSRPVCPTGDLNCYFLPLSACPPNPRTMVYGRKGKEFQFTNKRNVTQQPSFVPVQHRRLLEYASRPQTWLRKAVYEFAATIDLAAPCTVLHVRRSDVILHGKQSRRYHAIREYMESADDPSIKTIFLLTDDDNAIQEALTEFPNHHWVYVPRPRFKGAEGGWENQLPSSNPQFEVVVLLAIFQKVTTCQSLIHTQSNFADYLKAVMLENRKTAPTFINLDKGLKGTDIFSTNHSIGLVVPGGPQTNDAVLDAGMS